MDYELIKTGALVLSMLSNCVIGAIAIDARRQRVTTKAIDELNKRLDEKCAKIAKLDAELNAMPTRQEIIRIHERIDGKFADIDGRLERIQERIDENAKDSNLLLGQLLGQVKQMNESNA